MVGVTSLVVVDGSLVAHGADGGHFPEGGEVVHADWPAAHGHLSLGLERLPTDGELVERRHVSRRPRRLFEYKHLNKPTHIKSKSQSQVPQTDILGETPRLLSSAFQAHAAIHFATLGHKNSDEL